MNSSVKGIPEGGVQVPLQLSLPAGPAEPLQYAVRLVGYSQIRVAVFTNKDAESLLLGCHHDKLSAISE